MEKIENESTVKPVTEDEIHDLIARTHKMTDMPIRSRVLIEHALCVVLETVKWKGEFHPIARHGYADEKIRSQQSDLESMKNVLDYQRDNKSG